jgi:hypothetical protein
LRKYSAAPKYFAQNSKKQEFTGWKFQRKKKAAKKLFSARHCAIACRPLRFWSLGESAEDSSSRVAARNGADF